MTGGGENYVYLGDAAGEAYLLVAPDQTYLLTNNIELRRRLDEEVPGLPFEAVTWSWRRGSDAREKLAAHCDVSKAASDLGSLGLPKVLNDLLNEFHELRYTMDPAVPALGAGRGPCAGSSLSQF